MEEIIIDEMKECYVMKENDDDIKAFATCLTSGFRGYPLFDYFFHGGYKEEKVRRFWEISIRASEGKWFCAADSAEANAVVLFSPPDCGEISLLSYLKAGAVELFPNFGLKSVIRMQKFESFAGKIQKKYMTDNCWYLYCFAAHQESRHQGYGSKLVKPMFAYFDRIGADCYLETLVEKNVSLYEHFGFELVESIKLSGTDMTLYAMLRKAQK